MKALDTNILVRLLVADDQVQARRVRDAFEDLERTGERFMITSLVLLELIWVLSAVYDFSREEVTRALELLSQMPVLEFQNYDHVLDLTRLGSGTKADLSDILIGLAGRSCGCEATLTFDKRLTATGLYERL
jgi:predicted nucleic-acid-binding protein